MNPMQKKIGIVHKSLLILCLLFIGITAGNGFHVAADGKTIYNQLSDWFDVRTETSINEMDQAITTEKNKLMNQLREELSLEMQRAQTELQTHTSLETNQAIDALQAYAAEISASLDVSNASEKQVVSMNIQAALSEAKRIIQDSAIVPTVKPDEKIGETPNLPSEKEANIDLEDAVLEPTVVEDDKPLITKEPTIEK